MHAASPRTSTYPLLAGMLAMAASFTSMGASANVPPELATGMVQMAANLNHAAVACAHMSAKQVQSLREQQRAEFLKTTPAMSVAEYERIYADASQTMQAKWTSLTAAQKQQTCTSMKQLSQQAAETVKNMPK